MSKSKKSAPAAQPASKAVPVDRLAAALVDADPDVQRALALAQVGDEAALAAFPDWRLLQLPRVGKTTVRKVQRLRQRLGLGLASAGDRPSHELRLRLSLQLEPAQHQRLLVLAKAAGLLPREWLQHSVLHLLRDG